MGLHDLVLDLSRHLASRQVGFMEKISRGVLDSYLSYSYPYEDEGNSSGAEDPSVSWYGLESRRFRDALVAIDDDGFVLRNVFRLLHRANLVEHGIALLTDPRWLDKQFKACRRKQVDQDIAEMIEMLDEGNEEKGKLGVRTFLKMVQAAPSESELYILKATGDGMFATQMYGRSYHYKSYIGLLQFLTRIEKVQKVSWVKCNGVFPAPQPSFSRILEIDNVLLVRYRDDQIDIISLDHDKKVFRLSQYSKEEDVLKRDVLEWKLPRRWWKATNVPICEDVGYSLDGGTVVVGMGSEMVLFERSTTICASFQYYSHFVTNVRSWYGANISCLSLSGDGQTLVSGNEKGKLTVWKRNIKKQWKDKVIGRLGQRVRSLSVSDDGRCIVLGFFDTPAVVWTLDINRWKRFILPSTEKMSTSAVSKCGSLIVTFSYPPDSGHLIANVWTKAEGDWQSEKVEGTWPPVFTVAVSSDNKLIVCGMMVDVCVFRLEDGRWKSTKFLQGNRNYVRSVAIHDGCGDAASALSDGTVRVFDLDSRNWLSSNGGAHTYRVCDVALSANRIVSAIMMETLPCGVSIMTIARANGSELEEECIV